MSTKKFGGKEVYRAFFYFETDKKHKCKICNGMYSQDTKKGCTNLVTPLTYHTGHTNSDTGLEEEEEKKGAK